MPDNLPDMGDPGFFTLPGRASLFGIFMAVQGIAVGDYLHAGWPLGGGINEGRMEATNRVEALIGMEDLA